MPSQAPTSETHPLFPSGDWEGFFTYAQGPGARQFRKYCTFTFFNKIVMGGGSDEVGEFAWKGTYDTEELWCNMTKYYATHTVQYAGNVDENGIWGKWNIRGFTSGWFHLWPVKGEEATAMAEATSDVQELKIEVPGTIKTV